jgi:hypothetical protein
MRKLFLLLLLAGSGAAQSQKVPDPKPFANGITEDDLKNHLYIVASRDFEGRETATEGQRKAAAYIEAQFKSFGLLPANHGSYQLSYPVFQDSLLQAAVEVNGTAFSLFQDFDVSVSGDYPSTLMGGEVVFAGYGLSDSLQDDYKGLDVRGKIVLLLNGLPSSRLQNQINRRSFNPFGKQDVAQQHGAVAVMIIQPDFPRKAMMNKGNMYLNGFRRLNRPLTYYVSEKLARAIAGDDYDNLKNGQPQPKGYNTNVLLKFNKMTNALQSTDVVGYLEGTDLKDEFLVISAHYDHLGKRDTVIYYGADDDGSGTVSVLELAQAFSKAKAAGKGPRRSILFLANSGEEKGLWGSEFYTDHPLFGLDKTTADLNIDMIGRIDPKRNYGDSTNYVYVVGDDKLSSDLHNISVAANKKYTKLELDYKFNDPKDPERIYYRSDHYNFAKKGVPIIFYFDGIHKDYHSPTDTPDKINYDILKKRAQLVFYTAWDMANRQNLLTRDIPLK